jgi:hypothetical protein
LNKPLKPATNDRRHFPHKSHAVECSLILFFHLTEQQSL